MPDFAPTATPRYVVNYRSAGLNHSWTFRGNRGETSSITIGRGQNIATELAAALDANLADDFLFLSALYIPQDTEVSVGAALPTQHSGLQPVEDFKKEDKIRVLTFPGKSSNGSRGHISVWGYKVQTDPDTEGPGSDFIILSTESLVVANAITALNARAIAGIDDGTVDFYPYATLKTNDRGVKKVRKGSI